MTELKENAMQKAAELSVKAALIKYLSDFERYTDYENELAYCDFHANYDSSIDPIDFLNQSTYRKEDYFIGHQKYLYQYELIDKIIRAMKSI